MSWRKVSIAKLATYQFRNVNVLKFNRVVKLPLQNCSIFTFWGFQFFWPRLFSIVFYYSHYFFLTLLFFTPPSFMVLFSTEALFFTLQKINGTVLFQSHTLVKTSGSVVEFPFWTWKIIILLKESARQRT